MVSVASGFRRRRRGPCARFVLGRVVDPLHMTMRRPASAIGGAGADSTLSKHERGGRGNGRGLLGFALGSRPAREPQVLGEPAEHDPGVPAVPACPTRRFRPNFTPEEFKMHAEKVGLPPFTSVLSAYTYKFPEKVLRLAEYMRHRDALIAKSKLTVEAAFFCDLDHRPKARPHCGSDMGCLITHGDWWSVRMERPMWPAEHFVCQGLDPYTRLSKTAVNYIPWQGELKKLSGPAKKRLAGNALHCPTVAALLLEFLLNLSCNSKDSQGTAESAEPPLKLMRMSTALIESGEGLGSTHGVSSDSDNRNLSLGAAPKLRASPTVAAREREIDFDSFADGPKDMREGLDWAMQMVQVMDRESQQHVFDLMSRFFLVSHYSGVDCWALTINRLAKALARVLGEPYSEVPVATMCEKDEAGQTVLKGYGAGHCIFGNIEDCLDAMTQWHTQAAQPAARMQVGDAFLAWSKVSGILDEYFETKFDIERKAKCINHGVFCCLYPPHVRRGSTWPVRQSHVDRDIGVAVGSSTCVDFSPEGSMTGIIGKATLSFLVWKKERAKMHKVGKEKLILHECVEQFPDEGMFDELAETHGKVSVVLSPTWFGYPIRRPRRYTILYDKSVFQVKASFDATAIIERFGRKCALDADSFYIAPKQDAFEFLATIAKADT